MVAQKECLLQLRPSHASLYPHPSFPDSWRLSSTEYIRLVQNVSALPVGYGFLEGYKHPPKSPYFLHKVSSQQCHASDMTCLSLRVYYCSRRRQLECNAIYCSFLRLLEYLQMQRPSNASELSSYHLVVKTSYYVGNSHMRTSLHTQGKPILCLKLVQRWPSFHSTTTLVSINYLPRPAGSPPRCAHVQLPINNIWLKFSSKPHENDREQE